MTVRMTWSSDGWAALGRTLLCVGGAYVALVLTLRATGKRTLAKLNAFDLVVTVALGATMATAILSKDVAFAQGIVVVLALAGLQYVLAWASVRSRLAAGGRRRGRHAGCGRGGRQEPPAARPERRR